jgi:hypothetical protein
VVPHHRVFPDPVQRGHGITEVGGETQQPGPSDRATRRRRSILERGEVAGQSATTNVCRAEGGITVRPSGGRGVIKSHEVDRNGL